MGFGFLGGVGFGSGFGGVLVESRWRVKWVFGAEVCLGVGGGETTVIICGGNRRRWDFSAGKLCEEEE